MNTGWSGPWKVIRIVNDVVYEIESQMEQISKKVIVSIDRIRLYVEGQDHPIPLPTDVSEDHLRLPGNEFVTLVDNGKPPSNTSITGGRCTGRLGIKAPASTSPAHGSPGFAGSPPHP